MNYISVLHLLDMQYGQYETFEIIHLVLTHIRYHHVYKNSMGNYYD